MATKILFEESTTPIYQRIVSALSRSFETMGCKTIIVKPVKNKPREYVKRINNLKPDFFFITNPHSSLYFYDTNKSRFLFEQLKPDLVFLHHDNFFGPMYNLDEICSRFEAFIRASDKSTHLCIEDENINDLKKISVINAHKVFHASEFVTSQVCEKHEYNLSFVGHVLPDSTLRETVDLNSSLMKLIMEDYKKRTNDYGYKIESSAINYANTKYQNTITPLEWLGHKQLYRACAHNLSLFFRGRTISCIAEKYGIDVIGGDPSYLHDGIQRNNINRTNVYIHSSTTNYEKTNRIYSGSKINLNITPLQFDTAVINRVIDVGAAGGFILTDWKDDISELPFHEEISYKNINELKEKIELYLTSDSLRNEITRELNDAVKTRFTYTALVKQIMEIL